MSLHNSKSMNHDLNPKSPIPSIFEDICKARYACTRYQRYDNTTSTTIINGRVIPRASVSSPQVVQTAKECLDLSRRSPSAFNAQPYRLLMVTSTNAKEQVAKYCLGRNADRVRDSDCTVLFLADKECGRDYKRFATFLEDTYDSSKRNHSSSISLSKWSRRKLQALVLLFSSGWPFPNIISNVISFCVRVGVSLVSVLTRRRILVPSLATSDTWATKNTMLVAMTYMLACTSKGLNTTPMEGFNVGGIRKVLNIPRRYSIPLIVSTGWEYKGMSLASKDDDEEEERWTDDVGVQHGSSIDRLTPRYPIDEVIFENSM